jgi:mannose-1-phosphate guanylyltransferase
MENHIVIMAGGIGSRLWPMSTPEYPKQFVDVIGCGKSLIQLTVERFLPLCPIQHMWVVTSERYTDIVKEQLPELPESQILAEPEARNTAPCIAYACWKIKKEHPHANIVVTPSDALVINTTEFARYIAMALNKTADSNAIVTLGIKPSRPETGYGYIAAKVYTDASDICEVEAFKEKPDKETAQKYESRKFLLECRHLCMERRNDHYCHPRLCSSNSRSNGQAGTGFVYGKRTRRAEASFPYV